MATLDSPVFYPMAAKAGRAHAVELFYCTSNGAQGVGEYSAEGFVVHKVSTGRVKPASSIEGASDQKLRDQLLLSGVAADEGGKLVFTKDHLFPSASRATVALLARTANGWVE